MTDSEKIDLLLSQMQNMNFEMQGINNRLDKLDSQVSALKTGQIETRKEVKEVSIKVSETYALALESWGQSSENRQWLKTL